MKIVIETVEHRKQRYRTTGDWYWNGDGSVHIKVSKLSDWRREALVAVHELVEFFLCEHGNVSQEDVDRFDLLYEEKRSPDDLSEPGESPKAPYYRQHQVALAVERALAEHLEVKWEDYENELCTL